MFSSAGFRSRSGGQLVISESSGIRGCVRTAASAPVAAENAQCVLSSPAARTRPQSHGGTVGAASHASSNTERTILPGMLLVSAHAQCSLERPSRHPLLPAPHGRGAVETTIPSVPRGVCASAALSSAILARVDAVAAATKQTRARHWRTLGGGGCGRRGAFDVPGTAGQVGPAPRPTRGAPPRGEGQLRFRDGGDPPPPYGPRAAPRPPPAGAAAPPDAGK